MSSPLPKARVVTQQRWEGGRHHGKPRLMSFYLGDGSVCGSLQPPTRSWKASSRAWKTGLDLNPSNCDCIRAKPIPSDTQLTAAPQDLAIRHDGHFELLGVAFGPAESCLRKLQEKLDRAKHLMSLLSRLESLAVALVVAKVVVPLVFFVLFPVQLFSHNLC